MSESERPKNLPEWSACSPVPYMTLGSEPDGTVTVEGGAFDAGDVQAFTLNGVRFVRALRWTKERPTVPGWYWLRETWDGGSETNVVFLEFCGGEGFIGRVGDELEDRLELLTNAEWAGPTPAPAP